MIKIGRGLYIHFTTVLLFVVCYINRNLEILTISYISVFAHEIAHLLAAFCIGLKPNRIVFFPFGVNLKLKNTIIASLSDEIIVYLSGPFFNIIMALICKFLLSNKYSELLYYNNIALFLFNILPILPMDGGVIIKRILSDRVGRKSSLKILKISSTALIAILFIIQGYFFYKNNYNFSVLIAIIFLTGNIFTNKEKYNLELTRQLMFYKQKEKYKIKKVKGLQIKHNTDYKELIQEFSKCNNYIIFKEDISGKIEEILTEKEILEKVLTK